MAIPRLRTLFRAAALLLGSGAGALAAVEVAGELLIELDAGDFAPGAMRWPQHSPDTGIPGQFVAHGSPHRQSVAGAAAIVFDGDGDYFTGPNTTTALHAPGATHSVEAWVYQGNIRDQESVVSWSCRGGPDGSFAGFRYGADPEFGAVARWGAPDSGFHKLPPPGRWHHIASTYDGDTQCIYVDGTLDGSRRVGALDAHNALPILIGAEIRPDRTLEGSFTHFSGALGRLRIHSGVLGPAVVRTNHLAERAGFPGLNARPLSRPPLHRYTFNPPAGPAPDGTPVQDSIGCLPAIIRGDGARFDSVAIQLPGGDSATRAYVDLPNGIISGHENLSIEFWATQSAELDWSRLLSCGNSSAGEIPGPGGEFQGGEGIALFGNVGSARVNRFTRSRGSYPNGGPDRDPTGYPESDYGTEFHHVIRYDTDSQHWQWFRDGLLMESIPDTQGPTGIEDVNVWLGRSEFSADNNLNGNFNELRVYNFPLSEEEIYGNFLVGPDSLDLAGDIKSLVWGARDPGGYHYANSPQDNHWGTGAGGPHPDGPGETASFGDSPQGRQDITIGFPVTLGALHLGTGGPIHLLAGPGGSLAMDSGAAGPAALFQAPGSPTSRLDLPLILSTDTEFINLSGQTLWLGGPLSGPGCLVKTGPGTLMLTGSRSGHTGSTRILNGALVLAGSTDTALAGAGFETIHPGRMILDKTIPLEISPSVSNNGHFLHRGRAPLTLAPPARITGSGFIESAAGAGHFTQRGRIDGARSLFIENDATLGGDSVTRIDGWVSVGRGSGGNLLVEDSALLEITQAGHLNVGDTGTGHSTMRVEGGTIRFKELHVGKNVGTSGVLIQNGGRLEKQIGGGDSRIGGSAQGTHQCWGAYHLNGGSFTCDWNLQVGAFGIGAMIINGGTASIDGFLSIGRSEDELGHNGQGLVDLAAGQLSVTSPERMILVGEQGNGELNIRGSGSLRCPNTMVIGGGSVEKPGHGIVNLLDGGLLTTGGIGQINQAAAGGLLNLDGGILRAAASGTEFLSGLDEAWIRAAGACIDSNGFDITIDQELAAPEGAGVVSIPVVDGGGGYLGAPMIRIHGGGGRGATAVAELGGGGVERILITNPGAGFQSPPQVEILGGGGGSGLVPGTPVLAANQGGGLTKRGAGSLRLNAACRFPGPISIEQGTLEMNGDASAATGPVSIENGATLAGNGALGGALIVKSGATLAPGPQIGCLAACSDVELLGRLVIDLTDQATDRIDVGGQLTIRGARLSVSAGASIGRSTQVIASYRSLEGRFDEPQSLPRGYTLDYHHNGLNQIALVFTGEGSDGP